MGNPGSASVFVSGADSSEESCDHSGSVRDRAHCRYQPHSSGRATDSCVDATRVAAGAYNLFKAGRSLAASRPGGPRLRRRPPVYSSVGRLKDRSCRIGGSRISDSRGNPLQGPSGGAKDACGGGGTQSISGVPKLDGGGKGHELPPLDSPMATVLFVV